MTDAALIRIEGDDSQLTAALARSKSSVMSWARDVSAVFTGVVGANLAAGVTNWFKEFVKGANEAARAERIFENTIYAMGDRAFTTGAKVKALRDEIAKTSTFRMSTGVAQNLMLVEGMTEAMMKKAAKASADLAASRGEGLESGASTIAGVLRNPGSAQSALRSSGVVINDNEQKAIDQLVKKGKNAEAQAIVLGHVMHAVGGAADAELNTIQGRWRRLINVIIEFGQKAVLWIEDKILKSLEALSRIFGLVGDNAQNGADAVIDSFDAIVKGASKLAHAIYEYLKPAFEWLLNAGVNAITAVQFAFEHWDKTLGIIRATVDVIKNIFVDAFKYIFGQALPAAASAGFGAALTGIRSQFAKGGGWSNWLAAQDLEETIRQNVKTARIEAVRENAKADGMPWWAAGPVAATVEMTNALTPRDQALADQKEHELNDALRFQLKTMNDPEAMRKQLMETMGSEFSNGVAGAFDLPGLSDKTKEALEKFNEAVAVAAPEFEAAKQKNLKIIEMVFGADAAAIVRGVRTPRPGEAAAAKSASTPSFEELTSLNRRIQEAAFKKDDPVVKAVDKNAAVVKGAVEVAAGAMGKAFGALSNQIGKLNLGFK